LSKAGVLIITIFFIFIATTPAISTNIIPNNSYENTTMNWYWKPPYPNYAPMGMPDFDQRQDSWQSICDGGNGIADSTAVGDDIQLIPTGSTVPFGEVIIAPGPNCKLDTVPAGDDKVKWVFCGPTAVANCFWWFDSKFADPAGTPGDGVDTFALVEDYGAGDDHAFANVPLLIEKLAKDMKTCSLGTTKITDMEDAVNQWLVTTGLDTRFDVNRYDKPTFAFVESEIERSQDVILLLGDYQYIEGEKQVDQEQIGWAYWDPIQTFTLWDYQEFVPTVNRLDAIQICITGGPGPIGINVYDAAGALLGTSIFDPGPLPAATWVQFHFTPHIDLIPGNQYHFDVWKMDDSYYYEWFFLFGDVYPPGMAWMDGNPFEIYSMGPFDWTFKTEYYDPIPGCYRMNGHFVTCAGVNSQEFKIGISDPDMNIANPGGGSHNNPQNVSHDIYNVTIGSPCPDLSYNWWLPDYNSGWMYTIVEQALIICPVGDDEPPVVDIVTPVEGYFHFSGIPLFPTLLNLIADTMSLGGFRLNPLQIAVADNNDLPEDIVVTILIDGQTLGSCIWNSANQYHELPWTGQGLGTFMLNATAMDTSGNIGWAEREVWYFCFLP
ncbi:MAG: hypothetical protein KKC68_02925, partial [Candidatus Thermoplasmatota archaeon]|nr:hypothetical protein [Candidatus Thermoplasmatota archaeon]MBU1940706.1 hypothetical protein [Candidatus Thermoplasmatota archaeon]